MFSKRRGNHELWERESLSLHRVSKNPAAKGNARVIAVVPHPRDAKQIAIPEPNK